jgi:two-component system response regulator TctD
MSDDTIASGRLLLVEDSAELSLWLGKSLRQRGFQIEFALDGRQADILARQGGWDLIVLDLSLPHIDGLEVLQRLRSSGDTTPVLILTARAEVNQRVRGLELGADDYLAKPFDVAELQARITALLRRPKGLRTKRTAIGLLVLDHEQNAFYGSEAPLSLTKRESSLLRLLFERKGRAVSKAFLHESVFGSAEANVDAVEVVIYRLRKKIEPCGVQILTVRGLGYMLECK